MKDSALLMCRQSNSYVAVVDDDESLCRSLSRLLRTAGFQTVTYGSAEAFLEDAKRPQFDCLILDVQLEGMSGLELSQHLVETHYDKPFIFITAHDGPEVRSQALACGCAAYFRKNDPGQSVIDAIRKAVGDQPEGSGKPAPSGASDGAK